MGEGNYEPGTVRIFDAVLREGDQVVIAGAHQGYFAVHCADLVGETGKVFAFEPEPTNREILTKATEGLHNVEVFPYALGDRNMDEVAFYINADNDGGHALWDVSKHPANEKTRESRQVIKAEIRTIDSLFADRDMSRLKLLMLDAEGAEFAILKGAVNTITDYAVPYAICEINPGALEQCQTSQIALRNFMAIYGYRDYLMHDGGVTEAVPGDIRLQDKTGREYVFNMFFTRNGAV